MEVRLKLGRSEFKYNVRHKT